MIVTSVFFVFYAESEFKVKFENVNDSFFFTKSNATLVNIYTLFKYSFHSNNWILDPFNDPLICLM